ncbi:lysophospholipase [Cupriavidus cauae]|uniref:Lysophospholipase n=2 Tax=Burkholderiaceae TaxID=119060 RepID=A0A5M8ARN7_9BURK|nr:lysophospholipase [Cupriavidus cauae]
MDEQKRNPNRNANRNVNHHANHHANRSLFRQVLMHLPCKTIGAAAVLTAAGFLSYWTYLGINQGRLLFDARRRPPRELPEGITAYSHTIPGGMLRGYVYRGDAHCAVTDLLFYLPGRGEDVLETMQFLHWLPPEVGFATFDYRGLGHSDGSPSEAAAVADASQFLLHLRRVLPGTRVHVVGRSLGTGVAIQLADLQDFESLQLITPYDSLLELVRKRFPLVPLRQLMRHHFDSISHCKKVVQRTKVLLAEVDDVVPHACSERLMAAWPGPVAVETIPGSNHSDIIAHQSTWQALSDFALLFARRPDLDAHGNRLDETPTPAPAPDERVAANDTGGGQEPPGLPVAAAPLRTDGAS